MRPSYRYAAIIAVLVGLVVAFGAWWASSLGPSAAAELEDRAPLKIDREAARPAAAPSAEKISEMLDRVEAAEVQTFGEVEAARRRRTREELLDKRIERGNE